MAKKLYEESNIQDIADAIREKNGKEDTYKTSEMGDAIRAIESDSYYDAFWDMLQMNGERQAYNGCFRGSVSGKTFNYIWNDEMLKPKYDIVPINVGDFVTHTNVVNVAECFDKARITFNTSKCTVLNGIFSYNPLLQYVPPIHADSVGLTNCTNLFRESESLKKAEIYNLPDFIERGFSISGITCLNYSFINCIALEELIITGTICHDISLAQSSLLTLESAKNVINCLKDYSGTDYAGIKTVKFHSDTWALLDAEGNAAPNGNTWKEYVHNLGWLI